MYAMKSRRSVAVAAASLLGASIACVAGAGPIGSLEMKFLGTGLGQNVRIDRGDGSDPINVFAGELLFETRAGEGVGEWIGAITLPTFCVEPTQMVQSNWRSYDISATEFAPTPMMDSLRAMAINSAASYFFAQRAMGGVDSAAAAGFQIALWEIVRDFDPDSGRASMDISAGSFVATNTSGGALPANVRSWASQVLDIAASATGFDGQTAWVLSSPTSQDQIIPAPGGAALAGVGVLIFSSRRRRGRTH